MTGPDAGRFAEVFAWQFGPGAAERLTAAMPDAPVLLLAGNQLTGKSTAARQVARALGVRAGSTGTVARRQAAALGLSIETYAAALEAAPGADARLDHAAFQAVARGEVGVFESRLAGWMGAWLRGRGRRRLFAAFVTCSARERALRWVRRELDAETAGKLRELLGPDAGESLAEALRAVARLPHPRAGEVAARMDAVAARERLDRDRLQRLYGVDFLDPSPCDLLVDNTGRAPEQTRDVILAAARAALELG